MTQTTPTGIIDQPADDPKQFDIDNALDELFALKSGVTYALDVEGNFFDPMRIPRKLDSDSTANWTRIPHETGQSERSDAGSKGFTLSLVRGSSFWFGEAHAVGFLEAGCGHGAELSTDARQTALPL